MKQMTSGMIAFVGVLAIAGCYSYTGEAINNTNYNTVQATPQFAVVKVGDSDQMLVRLVNDANNGAITSYTISEVGAGIEVHYQPHYRPVYDSKLDTLVDVLDKNQQQYYIVGKNVGKYTFKVTPTLVNTGISTTVTVIVSPKDLGPALSKTTGAAGDTVVITAPAGTVFSQTSAVSFTTGVNAVVARAADSTSITIVVGGGVTGPATVTKVGVIISPTTAPVSLVSTNTLTTTAINKPTLSTTTAAAGATVTLTAGANTYFSPTSAVTFPTGSISVTSRAADSSSISFLVGPGITGAASVTLVGLRSAPVPTLAATTQTSTNTLTTTALTVAPTTAGSLTPAMGTTTTVALGANLRFTANSHVFIGGTEAGIQSVSADSSTATILPMLGSTGLVTYTNIVLSFLNTVGISVPGDKSITVGAVYAGPTDPNTNTVATAPTLTLTGTRSIAVADGGALATLCNIPAVLGAGATCKYWKVTATATTMSGQVRWISTTNNDLGLYTLNAAGTTATSFIADVGTTSGLTGDGPGTSSSVTTGAVINLTAGTTIIAVVQFTPIGSVPTAIMFRIAQP